VGHSTYPNHYQNGWHSTGTVGAFGSTAAAAHLLGLSVDETITAFGIVASASSALKKNFGSMTKPLHAGHAAETGLRAALLAENGFTADNEILEGKIGYGEVMTTDGSYDPDIITEGLGEEWAVLDLGFKPHPSGVITHAAMDALRTLVIDHDLTPDSVDAMTVALDDAASEMLHHANPDNALQAKFSIEFCLAAILRERKAGIHEFTDEYVTQPETAAVIDKIDRAFEENLFDAHYASYGARVTVETTDGETLVQEVKHHPGSPNNPVSEERLQAKFDECVLTVLDDDRTAQLAETIDALEDVPSVDDLVEELQP
jgi:2-methylcitrate dehydratase PrpD